VEPLDNDLVRRALQYALDRDALLDSVYKGRGSIENGIFPHGLYGYNDKLPKIPYDPDEAESLLSEAGYADGFDLTISLKSSATKGERDLMEMAASMWQKVGVRAEVKVIEESEWMSLRKCGQMACYSATWTADYNDPDNFIYTFFGNKENTTFRSLCYPREEIMERVRKARTITDHNLRLAEYRELEQIIVQEDAAWIPLFSRLRYYVKGDRLEGMKVSWNGSVKNNYRLMSVNKE
jgi:ABC-type transport system substrate-binding protein